jgi:hypothetical protein
MVVMPRRYRVQGAERLVHQKDRRLDGLAMAARWRM